MCGRASSTEGRPVTYARGTEVPADRTRVEIERLLAGHGATSFVSGYADARAAIGFTLDDRQVRIDLPLPRYGDSEIRYTPTGQVRSEAERKKAFGREERRRWRALSIVLKAKLVAVEEGISTVEREFLADVVLPDGSTVGAWAGPQLEAAYANDSMPALLPGGDT